MIVTLTLIAVLGTLAGLVTGFMLGVLLAGGRN